MKKIRRTLLIFLLLLLAGGGFYFSHRKGNTTPISTEAGETPSWINGRVNSGISPNVAEENNPRKKPMNASLSRRRADRLPPVLSVSGRNLQCGRGDSARSCLINIGLKAQWHLFRSSLRSRVPLLLRFFPPREPAEKRKAGKIPAFWLFQRSVFSAKNAKDIRG